jgi:polysaccharide export outer membrane protein
MINLLSISRKKSKVIQFLSLISITLYLSSCIATKRVVYVEDKKKEDKSETYTTQELVYKIIPGDRFYIKITDPLSTISLGTSDVSSATKSSISANIIIQSPSVQDYLVNENGSIDYPLLGEIKAEGKTIAELITHIKESCKGYIGNPSVKLYMTNYNVTVLGEVNNPNRFQMITYKPTFFDAVGLANDLTDFADRKRVKIIRTSGDKVSVNYIDVTNPSFISSPYYFLQPNDVIHVMPLKVKKINRDNALSLVLSSIATIFTIITITTR